MLFLTFSVLVANPKITLYGHDIEQSMDQSGKVANPVRGQLEMNISLSPLAPESLVSRDGFGRLVPRQPAHSLYSGSIRCLLTEFLPISAAASISLCNHTPSDESRVYRVTQLRTDGAHCPESARTGPVVLNVDGVTGAAFAGHHGPFLYASLFLDPLLI